jgi:hypothetical protein
MPCGVKCAPSVITELSFKCPARLRRRDGPASEGSGELCSGLLLGGSVVEALMFSGSGCGEVSKSDR